MKNLMICVLLTWLASSAAVHAADALPAFPGAEGWGSATPGGRGGKIYEVTTLGDGGPGSLRDAVEAKGPRIVVFRISGTIPLARDLAIDNSNITIAGQTAPGDGICIRNYKVLIRAQDVVIRYLRIRRGASSGRQDDGLGIEEPADNVIIDHCTISWTCDEAVNTWHGAKNTTIQWCMISEALHNAVHAGHGFAATLGGTNTTYHHNLIASCPGRNPSIGGNDQYQTSNLDFRNNVIFNWEHRTTDGKPLSINVVNNYYRPGPSSQFANRIASIDKPAYKKIQNGRWYVAGNFIEGEDGINKNNRAGVIGYTDWLVDQPVEAAPVRTQTAQEAFASVLEDVGATLPHRDPVDIRIINEVKSGKPGYGNGIVQDPKDVGGWPELKSTDAPADADHDGMPDWWETKYKLNPNDPADGSRDLNGDGYTNIEKYLNGVDPAVKIDWRDADSNQNRLKAGALESPSK